MAAGAPDHHLPMEVQLDTLTAKMADVETAVNNLKDTLTNLNIMPPVVETPWAFKLIGKAGLNVGPLQLVEAAEKIELFEITGSGALLHLVLNAFCDDIGGRYNGMLYITIDDVEIFGNFAQYLFAQYASVGAIDFGLSGIPIWDAERVVMHFDIPLYYSSSIKVEWKNTSALEDAFIAHAAWYTNLP